MTIEELLDTRYLVISDYPNTDFEKGEIIDTKMMLSPHYSYPFFSKYPHIFKKLKWWQSREKKDMPDYVIQRDREDGGGNKLPDLVIKIKKHFSAGNGEWRDDSTEIFASYIPLGEYVHSYSYSGFEPATKEEYEQYLQSK